MGVLFERPGAAKVGQGTIFDGNPGHILTISFFALNAFWKASRGSWECVRGQRTVPREGQESFSSSLWGIKRQTRCDSQSEPKQEKSFLDAPFYNRAAVSTTIKGKKTIGVFEALDLRRFRNPLLMFMLAVRVPRRKIWKHKA